MSIEFLPYWWNRASEFVSRFPARISATVLAFRILRPFASEGQRWSAAWDLRDLVWKLDTSTYPTDLLPEWLCWKLSEWSEKGVPETHEDLRHFFLKWTFWTALAGSNYSGTPFIKCSRNPKSEWATTLDDSAASEMTTCLLMMDPFFEIEERLKNIPEFVKERMSDYVRHFLPIAEARNWKSRVNLRCLKHDLSQSLMEKKGD